MQIYIRGSYPSGVRCPGGGPHPSAVSKLCISQLSNGFSKPDHCSDRLRTYRGLLWPLGELITHCLFFQPFRASLIALSVAPEKVMLDYFLH